MLPQGSGKLVSGAISFSRSCYPVTMHSVKAVVEKYFMGLEKVKRKFIQSLIFFYVLKAEIVEERETIFKNANLKGRRDTSCTKWENHPIVGQYFGNVQKKKKEKSCVCELCSPGSESKSPIYFTH